MTRWHALGLVLCMGMSFGVNEATRPRFEYAMGPNERVEVTGWLKIDNDGSPHQFDLASIQVVAGNASRLWGSGQSVRELWMRSAELEAQSEPDLELFFDLSGVAALDPSTRSLDPIKGRELPVVAAAVGARLLSRVRLPAASTHVQVRRGTLVIRSTTPLPGAQGATSIRATGDLNLGLQDGQGERQVSGTFDVPINWY